MNRIVARFDPETAHRRTLAALRLFQGIPGGTSALQHFTSIEGSRLQVDCLGRSFSNPLGLAAGFDKNGEAAVALLALGFGHIEVGTVTPRAQAGNKRPRLARLANNHALLNSLGFPNVGACQVADNLSRLQDVRNTYIIGANLGPNRSSIVSPRAIVQDYLCSMSLLNKYVDYFVLNVSSPNTPGLVDLQDAGLFDRIGGEIMQSYRNVCDEKNRKPLLVKISPGIPQDKMSDLVDAAVGIGFSGFIATNSRAISAKLEQDGHEKMCGLSGAPIRKESTEAIRFLYRKTSGTLPIIGCGGILCAEDAIEKLRSGACLLQTYSGLVYNGPLLPRSLKKGLEDYCDFHGLPSLLDVRGVDAG